MSYIVSSGEVSSGVSLYCDSMTVLNGGTATETTVDYGGNLHVSSGGAAVGTVANSMGKIYVSSGGSIVSTTLTQGDNAEKCLVYAGAVASDTVVDGGADLDVYGTAYHTIVQGGSYPDKSDLFLRDGGVAYDTTISSGAWLSVEDKCYASGVQVSSGGSLVVSGGGTATDAIVDSYANIYVSSGGTALQIKENGGYVKVADGAEVSFVANVLSGLDLTWTATVHSGTTATSTTVNGGDLYVSSGGTAMETTVNSSGNLHVSSGGMAIETVVDGTWWGYGQLYVFSGGTAMETTVNSSGNLHVSSGGTATATTVNSGGVLYVSSGGSALQIKENGGYVKVADGAEVSFAANAFSGLTIESRQSATVHSGTTATSTIVNSSGNLHVSSGGTAMETTVNSSGNLHVSSGGMATSTTVNDWGHLHISSGGTATSTTVNGGDLYVSSGGTALQIKENGGYVEVADDAEVSFVANVLSGLILNSGQSATAHSGTTATSTTVNNWGQIVVSSGGTATDTIVNSYGRLLVSSGGTATTTTVNSDGNLYVCSGGTATTTTVNGGDLYVSSGGTALQIKENGGYVEVADDAEVSFVANAFSGLVLSYYQSATVHSGTTAASTIVDWRGDLYVSSGGTAMETIVNSGGNLHVSCGGSATIAFNPWHGGSITSEAGASVEYLSRNAGIYYGSENCFVGKTDCSDSRTIDAHESTIVYDGGTATSATVNFCGNLHVSSGGTALQIKENGGYVEIADGAEVSFAANAFSGLILSSGQSATVHSGTTATSTTVNSGGDLYVSSGGTATSTTVNSRGNIYVSNGGTALQIKENGGYVEVADDAEVSFVANVLSGLILSSGQSATAHSGTTATSAIVNSDGKLYVCGGTAMETTVNSGGDLYVSSGGTAMETVVDGTLWVYGQLYVSSGGMATSTTVNDWGHLHVSSGGTATSTTVNGGDLYVFSGGTATGITAAPYAKLHLTVAPDTYAEGMSNGSAFEIKDGYFSGHVLTSGMELVVCGGGTTTEIAVDRYCRMFVSNSGTIIQTTVNSSGNLHVSSGGTATSTTVNGGDLHVSSGGTAMETVVDGTWWDYGQLYVSSGGMATSTTVNSDGDLYVSSGGTATSTTVNSDGELHVSSGGTATSTTVNSGGELHVSSGGMATATTVNDWGNLHVSSGGTATGIIADSGARLHFTVAPDTYIEGTSNGSAFKIKSGYLAGYDVGFYNSLNVLSGGTATETTVDFYGKLYVSSGGTALQIKENGGYVEVADDAEVSFAANAFSGLNLCWQAATVHSGTTATSTTVSGGSAALCVFSGGTTFETIVGSGGRMVVTSGGMALQIKENGGYVEVADGAEVSFVANVFSGVSLNYASATVHSGTTATATTVNSSGNLHVSNGGTAMSTTISGWGAALHVSNGGTATGTTVNNCGGLYVSSGGTATGIVANSGAHLYLTVAPDTYIEGTSNGSAFEMKNGFLSGYTANGSGSLDVLSGGTAMATTISGWGAALHVSNGGTAMKTTVNSRGDLYVSSGGTATGIIADSGACLHFTVAPDTYIEGTSDGSAFKIKDAFLSGNVVNGGESLDVMSGGTVTAMIVNSQGAMCATSGGIATSTTVNSFGCLHISSGGTATTTTINSYGDMYVSSGGTVTTTTVNSWGRLHVSSGGIHRGKLSIASGATVFAYAGAVIDFTLADATQTTPLIDHWDYISGGNDATYTVTLAADQQAGNYLLAQGVGDFACSVTLRDDQEQTFATISIDEVTIHNGFRYQLVKDSGNLSMRISDMLITITADSAEKNYDGTALTAGYSFTQDVLIPGDELVVTVTGSQTDAGSAVNHVSSYKVMRGDVDVTSDYHFKTVDGTLTVNKRNVTLTSDDASKTYDGTALTAKHVTADSFAAGEGASYDVTGSQLDAGTSKNAFTYKLNANTKASNYNITVKEGDLTVASRGTITITAKSASKTYDGTALTESGYTFTDGVLVDGDELVVTVTGSQTDAGSAVNHVESYKVMRGSVDVTANYVFTDCVDGTLTVNKRAVTLTSDSASKTYDGTVLTAGNVTADSFAAGEGATFDVTGSQTDVGTSKNAFTYTLNDNTKAANYDISVVEGDLTVDPIPIVIKAGSASKKYDGTALTATYTYTGKLQKGDELLATVSSVTDAGSYASTITGYKVLHGKTDVSQHYAFTTVDGNFTVTPREITLTSQDAVKSYDGTALSGESVTISGDGLASGEALVYDDFASRTNAGSCQNTFQYQAGNGKTKLDNYEISVVNGTLTVEKSTVTLTSDSAVKVYDGTPLTAPHVTAKGFAEGEGATYTVTGSQTAVGWSYNSFDYALKEGTETANYVINKIDGVLEVIDKPKYAIVITAGSDHKTYDGTALTTAKYSVSGLLESDTITVSVAGSQTNAGTSDSTVTGYQIMRGTIDVTKEYAVQTVNGSLTVDQRDVTLTSDSATKVYDGTVLTAKNVTADGFVEGEGATYNVTGNQTEVGTSKNTFTYALNAGTEAANYNITTIEGDLTVASRGTITITAKSASKTYDGTALTESGYTFTDGVLVDGDELVVTVTGSQTDAGSAVNHVESCKVMRGSVDVTANYLFADCIDGTLTVTGRNVILTSDNASKTYDGKALVGKVFVSGSGFVEGEATASASSLVDAGSVTNAITVIGGTNYKESNYDITKDEGTLTIDRRKLTLTSGDSEWVYDGKTHTNTDIAVGGSGFAGSESAIYENFAAITEVGEVTNTFDYTLVDGAKAGNYDISTKYGALRVTKATITVTGTTVADKVYDGTTSATIILGKVSGIVGSDDVTVTVTGAFAQKDADVYDVTVHYALTGAKAGNYQLAVTEEVISDVEINQREVTLTSDSATKIYDGTALTAKNVTADGFVDGEGATYNVTGNQTEVGTSKNTFTYALNAGTEAANYNITTVEGDLTVTPVYPAVSDYNKSGKSDMVQFVNGYVYVTYDTPSGYVQTDAVNYIPPEAWQVAEVRRDLTGDGYADIQITSDDGYGSTWVATLRNDYLQTGCITLNYQFIGAYDNQLWNYLGSADFNGDGKSEILMVQTDAGKDAYGHRNVVGWVTDTTTCQWIDNIWLGALNDGWSIAGTADLTGDGKDNLILRGADGMIGYWADFSGMPEDIVELKNAGDRVLLTTGDFDGDGAADFLWKSLAGDEFSTWTNISGTLSDTVIGKLSDLGGNWQFAGVGDYNGDGKDEILWCDTSTYKTAYGEGSKAKFAELTVIV